MAVRIKESETPYKGGIGIEITNNHIINVLLREANNLIHVNENNELYVDLQLPDGIEPDDDFPVGVTTGKILQEDGWQQSGLILNRKTTSGDYARLIYANDGNLYVDLGDGVWQLIGGGQVIADINTKTFYLPNSVTDISNPDLVEIQKAMDWYFDTKNSILWYQDEMYVFYEDITRGQNPCVWFIGTDLIKVSWQDDGTAHLGRKFIKVYIDTDTNTVTSVESFSETEDRGCSYLATNIHSIGWFRPTELNHPVSLGYLNEELAKKQDLLTAGTRITIQTDPNTGNLVISADVSGVMTYKGNVTDPSQLPASGNVGDCWYSESDGHMYAWDGTQWKDIGGITPNLTNYFNKTIDDSDDITQGSINLFVTQTEKNIWNGKQDKLTAGQNITIDSLTNEISATDTKYFAGNNITIDQTNHIHNDAPFEPDNAGSMGQVLTKTSNGYEWKIPGGGGGSYTGGHGININQNNVISNSLPFEPDNQGQNGQVLKTDGRGNYYWANESGGGSSYTAGDGINIDSNNVISNTDRFIPSNAQTATAGQMLVKTQNGYEWQTVAVRQNVKLFTITSNGYHSSADIQTAQEALDWYNAGNMPILAYTDRFGFIEKNAKYFFYPSVDSYTSANELMFSAIPTENQYFIDTTNGTVSCRKPYIILNLNNSQVTSLSIGEHIEARDSFLSTQDLGSGYMPPFNPTRDYHPTTKDYVDKKTVISSSAPSNPTTGMVWYDTTNSKLKMYNGSQWTSVGGDIATVISGDAGVTYTIKVSNSDPASGTANDIITLVP